MPDNSMVTYRRYIIEIYENSSDVYELFDFRTHNRKYSQNITQNSSNIEPSKIKFVPNLVEKL